MKYDNGKDFGGFIPLSKEMAEKIGKMKFSEQTQKVFWFIIAKTIGFESEKINNESMRQTGTFLAPDYVSLKTGVPVASVRRTFKELEARGVIKTNKKVRTSYRTVGSKVKQVQRPTTWVELNTDTSKWVADPQP